MKTSRPNAQVADDYGQIVRDLRKRQTIISHSFDGLLGQILTGRGLAAATLGIGAVPFRGLLPLPLSALTSA